jgi:hypothetical protein
MKIEKMINFKNTYESATNKLKLEFLDGIISENRDLQTAFVNFANSVKQQPEGITYQRFNEIVVETLEYYKDRFEDVDLENPDWENYKPLHSGYIEEWEACQAASEQEFDQIFNEFKYKALDSVIQQKPDELTAALVGLYEATQDAEVPDEYESFHDVNEYLLSEHKRIMNEIIEKLRLSAMSSPAILNATELFFSYCDQEYPENEHFPGYFEDFLMTLADKSDVPEMILSALDGSTVERKALPRLVLLLNQKSGNSSEWLQSARQYYQHNNDVAAQLLKHYFENNTSEFLKLAYELFEKEPRYWAHQLRDLVSAELDTDLFVNVFYRLVADKESIKDYLELKPYLAPERLEDLLTEIESNKPFKVQVLAAEKRYEEIKTIVKLHPGDWHYPELISPILAVYPEFCFNHIKQKVLETIENQRGRSTYQRIAEWLKMARAIPGHIEQTRVLALTLYNHKPALPALKDELRKGGLM